MAPLPRPLLLIFLALAVLAHDSDFSSKCPAACDCKWIFGKKTADCTGNGLTTIPERLSKEIEYLDISGNPLHKITQRAFQMVGLTNLRVLTLRNCSIQAVHKNAFRNLGIVIELDLSNNSIKKLHPDTFNHTRKLRWVNLNNNQLKNIDDGLFKNLPYLQMVTFTHNHIHKIGVKAFANSPTIRFISLDFNNLTYVNVHTINLLTNLSSLDLHDNPWKCDCNLRPFRDWIIDHHLYSRYPTSCAEPPLLDKVHWGNTESNDFACKPSIVEPVNKNNIQVVGETVTLSCKAYGNPTPDIVWIKNSTILKDNSTRPGERKYHIKQSSQNMTKLVNITITHVKYHDREEYTCVAINPGGVEERIFTLDFQPIIEKNSTSFDINGDFGFGLAFDSKVTEIITIVAKILIYTIAVFYFCFYKFRNSKVHLKSEMHLSNGEHLTESSVISDM